MSIVVGAVVTHHADGPDGQQHCESLPDCSVEIGIADLLNINDVRLAEDGELLLCDDARQSDRKAWTWKWMSA